MLPLSRHSFVRATHRRLQEAHDGSNTAVVISFEVISRGRPNADTTARRTTRSRWIMQRIRNGTAMPLDVKFGTVAGRAATTEGAAQAFLYHRWVHVACYDAQHVKRTSRSTT